MTLFLKNGAQIRAVDGGRDQDQSLCALCASVSLFIKSGDDDGELKSE